MPDDTSQPLVSVLLPACNEEAAIGPVIDEVHDTLTKAGVPFEIIVVDDASDDRTAEFAAKRDVVLVRRRERGGSGAARKTGLLHATGEIVVMLDADGTYDARDIPKLLARMDGYDQVNGARTSEQGTLKPLRVPAKFLIRKLASYLTGRAIPDLNTGLKVFRRKPMMRYLHLIPDGFSCVTTMTLAFMTNGHPVTWVPVNYRPRIGESKFRPIRDTSNYLQAVVRIVMYFKPLKIFGPVGLGLLALGTLKTLVDFFVLVGRMQASDVVILMTGVLVLALGLLADLVVVHGRAIAHAADPDRDR